MRYHDHSLDRRAFLRGSVQTLMAGAFVAGSAGLLLPARGYAAAAAGPSVATR